MPCQDYQDHPAAIVQNQLSASCGVVVQVKETQERPYDIQRKIDSAPEELLTIADYMTFRILRQGTELQ